MILFLYREFSRSFFLGTIRHILGNSWLTLGGRPSDRVDTDDWLLILADWALRMADCTADCTADWAAVCWVEDWGRCPLVSDWELWEEELDVVLWDKDSWFRTCEGQHTGKLSCIVQGLGILKTQPKIRRVNSLTNQSTVYSLFYVQCLILPFCCYVTNCMNMMNINSKCQTSSGVIYSCQLSKNNRIIGYSSCFIRNCR